MVGGRLRCLMCVFTCSAVLLLGVCLQDVEASSCQRVIHKKVDDTVELSSCLPSEGVTSAIWRYGSLIITDKDKVYENEQFMGRLEINSTDFSLTLKRLTLKDSGEFRFISEVNEKQRETVTINLQVHEPITKQPDLTGNSTWHSSTNSCTVLLECSATSDSSVTYNWTVTNQIISGSRLEHSIAPQDGDTNFTCTIYNFISEKSATTTVKCSNNIQEINSNERGPVNFVVLLSLAAGACLIIVIVVGIVVVVCHSKQRRAGSDSNDLTVYADITEVANEDGTMKPCSVYETIDNRVYPEKTGPQTVYDKIQLNRVKQPSTSHYQDVS